MTEKMNDDIKKIGRFIKEFHRYPSLIGDITFEGYDEKELFWVLSDLDDYKDNGELDEETISLLTTEIPLVDKLFTWKEHEDPIFVESLRNKIFAPSNINKQLSYELSELTSDIKFLYHCSLCNIFTMDDLVDSIEIIHHCDISSFILNDQTLFKPLCECFSKSYYKSELDLNSFMFLLAYFGFDYDEISSMVGRMYDFKHEVDDLFIDPIYVTNISKTLSLVIRLNTINGAKEMISTFGLSDDTKETAPDKIQDVTVQHDSEVLGNTIALLRLNRIDVKIIQLFSLFDDDDSFKTVWFELLNQISDVVNDDITEIAKSFCLKNKNSVSKVSKLLSTISSSEYEISKM